MANKLWSSVQRGTYSAGTAYTIGDFVVYNGSSYTCIANSTGNAPSNATYWALVVSKGDTGTTGDTGATGDTGPAGTAATATVGSTTTLSAGSSATVTNVGTTSDAIFDFGIPRGADGTGAGDVIGPASATDNAIARFDTTTGKLLQNSAATVADTTGDITAGKYNKVTVTAPATGSTLTIADGQTLTVNGSATITNGTHSGTNTGDNTVATALTGTPSITVATVTTTGSIELGNASDTTIARVSAGVISVEGVTVPTISSTSTLTNKRITSRVQSVADAATITPNADSDDCVDITAIAQAFTIANPSGTPTNFQKIIIRIKDNGTARAITWGSNYVAGGVALPTTTVLSKITTIGLIYNTANSLNKFQCVAVATEA